MRVKLALAFAVLSLLFPLSIACAEERLDLGELLLRARQNNPELMALREAAYAIEAGAKAEGALDDPTLKIEMEDISTERPLDTGPGHSMLTRYTISQSFPFPGKLSLKERMAGKEALAARSEVKARELEVASQVKEAYFEYAFLAESIRITAGIKELITVAAKTAETRYATGQVTQQDVIRLNVEQAMLTGEAIMLEARKELAASKIKSLINMPQTQELPGVAVLPKGRVPFDANGLLDALASTPDIAMLKAETEASELGVKLADRNYYPDFMVGVAPIQRDGEFDSYDLMFQVNIPIWRGKYSDLAGQAKARARAARSRWDAGLNRKAMEVKGAAIEVEASARQIDLFETSLVPQAELSYESALRNYQTGRIDLIALLDTERDLRKTRVDHLKAVFEYNMRMAALERASGMELTSNTHPEKAEP